MSPGADIIVNERTSGDMLNMPLDLPALDLSAQTLEKHLVRNAGDALSFTLEMQNQRLELIPYYRIAHERYNLYWRLRRAGSESMPT